MALYAIGDLHLSQSADKPMDVFGEKWKDHAEKLKQGFAALGPEDVTVLCGDLSWAMDLKTAGEDFRFIHELPGQKIILKGNHDYWWSTAKKFYAFCEENGFSDMLVLLLIFVTDCVFFSMVWSSIVTRREAGLLLFLFASPILLFLTGFSWPEAAFPSFWKYFSYLFPTTFGCRAFINMNTAGADLYMVRDLIQGLLGQTAVYFLLACLMVHIENRVLKSSPLENSFPK